MSRLDLRNSVGVRLIIVGVLTFLLLAPAIMIGALISEREERRDEVAREISKNWGAEQVLVGPVLSIPYRFRAYNDEKKLVSGIRHAHFLPETLDVEGTIDPEMRNRGIYETVVYNCDLDVSAVFSAPSFGGLNVEPENIMWDDASVSFGISDMKGVKDPATILWNDQAIEANPGVASDDLMESGIGVAADLSAEDADFTFKTKLNLNGSSGLFFSPVGKVTTVHLESDWQNPSFVGDYLPTQRTVSDGGFESNWRVLHVSRDFPQKWVGSKYKVDKSLLGVSLLLSVDRYQKTMRTVKYAIMFISLTFLTFFVVEILGGKPIHPIQYLLIGFALLMFYALLLALSEHFAFNLAYIVASAAVVTLISIYSTSFLPGKRRPAIVAAILTILYGYLYIVLQLQDYALLMGSLVLFLALASMMYLTRKIDWFSVLNYRKVEE